MIQIDKTYDITQINDEIERLLINHTLVNDTQLLLQSPDGTEWYNITTPYKIHEDLRDRHFSELNIPPHWETARFIKENDLCRTRIMVLPYRKCYSWHHDAGHRIHLAIRTNDQCFFVEDRQLVNIPADGHPYLIDVNKFHTAMNCSENPFDRLHLVGVVK